MFKSIGAKALSFARREMFKSQRERTLLMMNKYDDWKNHKSKFRVCCKA